MARLIGLIRSAISDIPPLGRPARSHYVHRPCSLGHEGPTVPARMQRRRLASGLAACGLVLSTVGLLGPRTASSGPFEASEPAFVIRPLAVEVVPAEPHGDPSARTSLCGYCHRSHQAPGTSLHPYGTERETCYQCHNGGH